MSKQVNKTLIGTFILGAAALTLIVASLHSGAATCFRSRIGT
jgi:hypothetical protein